MSALGFAYSEAGRFDEALPLFESAFELSKTKLGEDDRNTIFKMKRLALAYEKAGQFEKARPLLQRKLELNKTKLGIDHGWTLSNMNALAAVYVQLNAFDDAENLLQECLAIRKEKNPDHWSAFKTKSMLGEALMGQQKFAEAEPFLLEGYHGLVERKDSIAPINAACIPESIRRLVKLYEAWHRDNPNEGYEGKVAQWQQKLEEYKTDQETKNTS
jgi:tetratricopeptide (TPR) repeat protein